MINGDREWYVPNIAVAQYKCETGDVNALVGRLHECVDVLDQQAAASFKQIDGEKIRAARDAIAPVIRAEVCR